MTKAELIIKFSNIAGIAETDAKVFFELLLKRLSAVLKSGQSINIIQFGYFHLIKGKIKKPALQFDDDENPEELIDIILYSEEEKLSDSETKGFVFNIPFIDENDYHPVDSYFSLSIGKPLIPLRGVSTGNLYIPTSGFEYRRFLESKVDELITHSKIISFQEQFPTLIIDASSYNSNQVHLEKNEDALDMLLPDQETTEQVAETNEENIVKNIAWDFGEDLSKKISAQSILELTDERINNFSLEISNKPDSEKEIKSIVDEEIVLDKLLENDLENDKEKEDSNLESSAIDLIENNNSDKPLNNLDLSEAEKLLDELNDFEEVISDIPDTKGLEEEITDEEFWKSASKLFETYNPREMRSAEDDEFTEVKSTTSNLGEYSTKKNKIDIAVDKNNGDQIEKASSTSDGNIRLHTQHKSKKWILIIFPLLLILVAATFYWYFQINKKNFNETKVIQQSLKPDNANIVERDYKIPVTYPYMPESAIGTGNNVEEKNAEKQEKSESKLENNILQNQPPEETKSNTKPTEKKMFPDGIPVTVGSNIYKYGETFVVQVASFRSNSIAENEAGKYKNKGFNAFVESVNLPDRGLWYRVRVGNFSSIDEAKSFISKNFR